MTPIADTQALAEICARLKGADYLTVDTEFIRESTYWPKLCLVQLAGSEDAAAVDALAPGIDLEPLFALLRDPSILKVFHSARQDVEIFVHLTGGVPAPMFDTQVAAMVCGFGESVAYDTLVARLVGVQLDKSSRFTDWARRPLSDQQLRYALADVVHLRPVYEALRDRLEASGRADWLDEEMAVLSDPATYTVDPREAWRRLKTRSTDRKFLAVLREVADWRETEAQKRNLPRGRLVRDEALAEIAAHRPKTAEALAQTRGISKSMAEGWQGEAILAAVRRGLELPPAERPALPVRPAVPAGIGPVVELLKVLLKAACEDHGVAQKLVASAGELEQIAADDEADVPALRGWRRKVFGEDALALKHGKMALAVRKRRLQRLPIGDAPPDAAAEPGAAEPEAVDSDL
jgi:ribonuclease D